MRLAAESVAQFARDGFVGPFPVLDPVEVKDLRARVDAIRRELPRHATRLYEVEQAYSERPDEVVCHFLGGWRVDDRLAALVGDRRLAGPCAQLLGVRKLRFFHDQVFYKPPRHPGVVPWHQDYSYWTRTEPPNHITINVMLDDADLESGCVQFVPGSHRWPLLARIPFDAPLEAIRARLPPELAGRWRPQAVPVPAGWATIHHSFTVHGSDRNRSDRPRRALVFNYFGDGTRVADDRAPLLAGVPWLRRGAVVEGEHFPLAFDAEGG
jgi:ectoine hydroxylase-related dioxygenase (phytanoyl-CoA dioxygenase family)